MRFRYECMHMKEYGYNYYENRQCQYYPCHRAATDEFNCLFCYCPLYALKDKCGGNFTYTDNGVKDCSNCLIPHSSNGYEYVMSHIQKVIDLGKCPE